MKIFICLFDELLKTTTASLQNGLPFHIVRIKIIHQQILYTLKSYSYSPNCPLGVRTFYFGFAQNKSGLFVL